jgi:hypothetical protein
LQIALQKSTKLFLQICIFDRRFIFDLMHISVLVRGHSTYRTFKKRISSIYSYSVAMTTYYCETCHVECVARKKNAHLASKHHLAKIGQAGAIAEGQVMCPTCKVIVSRAHYAAHLRTEAHLAYERATSAMIEPMVGGHSPPPETKADEAAGPTARTQAEVNATTIASLKAMTRIIRTTDDTDPEPVLTLDEFIECDYPWYVRWGKRDDLTIPGYLRALYGQIGANSQPPWSGMILPGWMFEGEWVAKVRGGGNDDKSLGADQLASDRRQITEGGDDMSCNELLAVGS